MPMENHTGGHHAVSFEHLLEYGEVIVVVDDDTVFREGIGQFLARKGYGTATAQNGGELLELLASRPVALVLLDIGLPDISGKTLLPRIVEQYPDLSVVMFTGISELQTAIECIRLGADDYLAKPSQLQEIALVVRKALEKRRILIDNRRNQENLQQTHFRLQLLHQLTLKMNSVYLGTLELNEILQGILVGITAEEGLGFNRAFLAIFDQEHKALEGRLAIGSSCHEDAGRIWMELKEKQLDFHAMIKHFQEAHGDSDAEVNRIVRTIGIPIDRSDHILIRCAGERRSFRVVDGCAQVPVDPELPRLLGEDTFVVVPLYSPSRSLGVIIADNFVTRKPISDELLEYLEHFANQASLAIEHSHLYTAMQNKIAELEQVTHELDKNKDMLVAAERHTALGQMAAQLVHAMRNPITKIGGAARVLARKTTNPSWRKFIDMMVAESARLESTMDDLFAFVDHAELHREPTPLYPLIHKTVTLLQTTLAKRQITCHLQLPDTDPVLEADRRQIRQMLLHLMKNGIEAMEDGGRLSIEVTAPGSNLVRIAISDTGVGMSEANIDRAMVPFFTTKTYGTGMGLTLVERIVKAHKGSLFLRSGESRGMTVTVELPLAAAGWPAHPEVELKGDG